MTKTVKIGNLKVGSRHPVRIKAMLKTPASQLSKLVAEARKVEKEGAEAIRIAVKEEKDAKLAAKLKKHISLPLVADVHFHHKLALLSIDSGFDSVRLNPLNIYKKAQVSQLARYAKKNKISIRVGVNSGGFKKNFSSPQALARQMVAKVGAYLAILEKNNFFDIMVSLKGSDVLTTITANRLFREKFDYPLHLGVTATGTFLEGVVKSSAAMGILLSEGIGDIIRISLTAPSFWEIKVAKYILQALDLRKFGPEIVSCPTCSRCEVDLIKIVDKFDKELKETGFNKPLRIALMGCVVNGPGEACQADIGAAFGEKKAVIFRKNKILGYSSEARIVKDLMKEMGKIWT